MDSVGDLIQFLLDPRLEVRQLAIEGVQSLTSSSEGIQRLFDAGIAKVLPKLINDVPPVVEPAINTAINISANINFIEKLLQDDVLDATAKVLFNPGLTTTIRSRAAQLLSNLTQCDDGRMQFLQAESELKGLHLARAVALFAKTCVDEPLDCVDLPNSHVTENEDLKKQREKDPFCWLAVLFSNISRDEEGRNALLRPDRHLLIKLFPSIQCGSLVRRRGTIGTIKNCSFQTNMIEYLVGPEVCILDWLLRPLVGPEPESNYRKEELLGFSPVVSKLIGRGEREKDDKCREELVDCLFLLSATSEGRDAMRDAHVYGVVRIMDLADDYEPVHEAVNRLVQHICADEVEGSLPTESALEKKAEETSDDDEDLDSID